MAFACSRVVPSVIAVALVVQLPQQPPPEMRDLGDREKAQLPSREGEAVAPIGFLAVEEERLSSTDSSSPRGARPWRRPR